MSNETKDKNYLSLLTTEIDIVEKDLKSLILIKQRVSN